MTSFALGALIDVESSENTSERLPVAPERAVSRTYSIQEPVELANVNTKQNGSSVSGHASTPSGTRTTPTPSALEMSRPVTPRNEDNSVEAMQSFSNPPMNKRRMLSVCLLNFGNGLNDSAPGALIPYIEKHYHIGYATVSLLFVTNAIGFVLAAFFVEALRSRLGRGRTLMISQALIICGYIPIVCTAPFPAIVFSFFLLGLGIAINLAMGNVFCANLHNATAALGVMHGSYGLGGTIGPLIATAMVTTGGLIFSRYYFITLAIAFFNLFLAGWSFWDFEAETGQNLLTPIEQTASRTQRSAESTVRQKNRVKMQIADMVNAFKSKTVILGALFIFAYQGAEVSISGWVISFLIATRHGNPAAVGYVTSGFWGGITLGRFLLSHPAHKIGEKVFVYGVILGAAVFELLVWLVPNVIGDAVAIAFVGLLLGPVYPCATVIFSRAIGRKEQVSSLSVISAFGSSGGAVAPFTTGILAQAAGTFVLHPIAIGLFAVMLVCWVCLPNTRKRTD